MDSVISRVSSTSSDHFDQTRMGADDWDATVLAEHNINARSRQTNYCIWTDENSYRIASAQRIHRNSLVDIPRRDRVSLSIGHPVLFGGRGRPLNGWAGGSLKSYSNSNKINDTVGSPFVTNNDQLLVTIMTNKWQFLRP